MEHLFATLKTLEPQVIAGVLVFLALVAFWVVRRRRAATQAAIAAHWEETKRLILDGVRNPIPDGDGRSNLTKRLQDLQAEPERMLGEVTYAVACICLCLKLNLTADAEKFLKAAQQRYPGKPEWSDFEIDLLVARRAADAKSIDRLCDACRRRPDQIEWHKRLLAWHISGGQANQKTIEVLQNFAVSARDPRAVQFVCEHHDRVKSYSSRLVSLFECACQLEPNKVRWLYALARCRHHAGDQEGARDALSQVLRLEPRHQAALEFQGLLSAPLPGVLPAAPSVEADPQTPEEPESEKEAVSLPERYTDIVEIGSGGMGTVYRAFDQVLSRSVAIKTLHESLARKQEGLRDRFLAESRSLAALDHPCILKVFDVSVGSPSFIAFEFINGEPLRQRMNSGPLSLIQVLSIGCDLASGFQHAVERGILHRDIKPENILIDKQDKPHIIDFGLAKAETGQNLTQAQAIIGTPWYLSPERLRGEAATPATEIYAFGFTLYEMLCGRRPFLGEDIMVALAQDPIRPSQHVPECPPRLEVLILECLSKNPNNRPASFTEIRSELEAIKQELAR